MISKEGYVESLKEFVYYNYNIVVLSITAAQRRYYGETWKIESNDKLYFVKTDYLLRYQQLFKNSLEVVDYFCGKGINYINQVVKTKDEKLSVMLNKGVFAIFEWIEAVNRETDETKVYEYLMISQLYALSVPEFNIPKEDFSAKIIKHYNRLHKKMKSNKALKILSENAHVISQHTLRPQYFSSLCKVDEKQLYFTHGDAGGNFWLVRTIII